MTLCPTPHQYVFHRHVNCFSNESQVGVFSSVCCKTFFHSYKSSFWIPPPHSDLPDTMCSASAVYLNPHPQFHTRTLTLSRSWRRWTNIFMRATRLSSCCFSRMSASSVLGVSNGLSQLHCQHRHTHRVNQHRQTQTPTKSAQAQQVSTHTHSESAHTHSESAQTNINKH